METDECIVCGRDIKLKATTLYVEKSTQGGYVEKGLISQHSQGYFAVGHKCQNLPEIQAANTATKADLDACD